MKYRTSNGEATFLPLPRKFLAWRLAFLAHTSFTCGHVLSAYSVLLVVANMGLNASKPVEAPPPLLVEDVSRVVAERDRYKAEVFKQVMV